MLISARGGRWAVLVLLLAVAVVLQQGVYRVHVTAETPAMVARNAGDDEYLAVLGHLLISNHGRSEFGPWNLTTLDDFAPLRARWYREEEQRLQIFDDQTYTPDSCLIPFVNGSCPVPGPHCPWKNGCAIHRNGTFRTKQGHVPQTIQRPLCSDSQMANGSWTGVLWKPFGCHVHRLTRRETWLCLRGKKVLVFGDSMMRNVFWRFVAMMRGMVAVSTPKVYTPHAYWMSATADHVQADGELPADKRVSTKAMEMHFLWAAHGFEAENFPSDYDILVGSYMYHSAANREDDALFQQLFDRRLAPHQVFLWVNTPRRLDPGKNVHEPRNQRWREWIETKRRTEPERYHYIDYAALHDNHTRWQRDIMGGTGGHFQCHLTPSFPVTGDCRDMMNLNVWSVILHVLCSTS